MNRKTLLMGHLWELCPILLEPTALNQHMQFLMNLDFLIDQTNVKALDRQVDPRPALRSKNV